MIQQDYIYSLENIDDFSAMDCMSVFHDIGETFCLFDKKYKVHHIDIADEGDIEACGWEPSDFSELPIIIYCSQIDTYSYEKIRKRIERTSKIDKLIGE